MGNFNVYTTCNKSLGQTAPSEPTPRPHTHSDSIINNTQVKKLRMD